MTECYLAIEAGLFAAESCRPWQIYAVAALRLGLVAVILGAAWHWRNRNGR